MQDSDKKTFYIALSAGLLPAGITVTLMENYKYFMPGLVITVVAFVFMGCAVLVKSRIKKFRKWLDKKIRQGEALKDSDLIDEINREGHEYDFQPLLDSFQFVHNVWTVKRHRVLRSVFGKDNQTWLTLDPVMERMALQHINNPLIWGGYRMMLNAEIAHLKMLRNMITTSEYFSKDFEAEIIDEIENDNPLTPKHQKLLNKYLK